MVSRPGPGRTFSEALCPECAFPCDRAPSRRLRVLARPPPQPGGGLLERICPVEPLSIVPRRPAGGSRPAPPGRRRNGKAQSARRGGPQAAPFREASGRDAPLREAARAALPRGPWVFAAGHRSSGQATAQACVQRAKEAPGSQGNGSLPALRQVAKVELASALGVVPHDLTMAA